MTTSYWAPKESSTCFLKRVAEAIYCVPATQASVERAFSIVSRILEPRRNRLDGKKVEMLTMLNWFINRRWGADGPTFNMESFLKHAETVDDFDPAEVAELNAQCGRLTETDDGEEIDLFRWGFKSYT